MPKKISLAEAKARLREAKADAREAKKNVSVRQKNFIETPSIPMGKAYRTAVAEHIVAVKAENEAQVKLDSFLNA